MKVWKQTLLEIGGAFMVTATIIGLLIVFALLFGGCATHYTLDELEDQLMVCENTGAACDEERDRMRSREDAIERRANRDYCDPRNCVLRGDPDWERRMRDMLGGGRGW